MFRGLLIGLVTRKCLPLVQFVVALIGLLTVGTATAQILPTPDYSGDLWTRSTLTGDWGGNRGEWAAKGLHFDLDTTVTYQNLVEGGLDEADDILGSTSLMFQLDTGKAELWPVGLLNIRGEARYGQGIQKDVGAIGPINSDALIPLEVDHFGDEVIGITELSYIQFLSEKFGIIFGLINTEEGDANEFAGSIRDNDRFLNAAFGFSMVEAISTPTVTLGAGAIYMPNESILGSLIVFDTQESALNNPFETDEGTTISTEWTIKHSLFDLPGQQTFGGLYAFGQDFPEFGNDPRFVLGQVLSGQGVPTDDETWALYYNVHQYVEWDGTRGWGLFGRFGVSDQNVNPIDWTMAAGIGGNGLFSSRPNDVWGIGYYHIDLADAFVFRLADLNDEDGVEVFYNAAITPWFHVTADVQVIDTSLGQPLSGLIPFIGPGGLVPVATGLGAIRESDMAWIFSLRVGIEF